MTERTELGNCGWTWSVWVGDGWLHKMAKNKRYPKCEIPDILEEEREGVCEVGRHRVWTGGKNQGNKWRENSRTTWEGGKEDLGEGIKGSRRGGGEGEKEGEGEGREESEFDVLLCTSFLLQTVYNSEGRRTRSKTTLNSHMNTSKRVLHKTEGKAT